MLSFNPALFLSEHSALATQSLFNFRRQDIVFPGDLFDYSIQPNDIVQDKQVSNYPVVIGCPPTLKPPIL